ncbi:hypothetical protein ACLBXM_18845 [Xanthobacteraceae bacterium A53D]
MTPDDQRRAAQSIIEAPLARALLAEMELAATRQCLMAPLNDDETRRNAAAEARAIIRLRERLEAMAQPAQSRQAPV